MNVVDVVEIPNQSVACSEGCIGDVCATVGTQSACGGCCGCLQRCAVQSVQQQLEHPMVRAAAEERARQQTMLRRTLEHDDQHADGELRRGAAAYALASGRSVDLAVQAWPWESAGFRPATFENRQRDLVKAAALLMAEWDRIEREKLYALAATEPQLVPLALCDQYQEIWTATAAWLIEVRKTQVAPGWLARVVKKGGGGAYPAGGDSPRDAVRSVLVAAGFDAGDAERLSTAWPVREQMRQFSAADIAEMLELGDTPAPDPDQVPHRGYHPDQATVQTDPPAGA